MRRLLPLAAVLPALLLSACAGQPQSSASDFKGTEADVAQVVEDLQKAAQDNDARRICDTLLARPLLQQMQGSGMTCLRTIGAAIDDADGYDLEVRDVQVNGGNATARVASGRGSSADQATVRLVREGSNWRISALSSQG